MTEPITPRIVYELTIVADPSLSHDGKRLAFVQSRINRDTMENQSQIMMMALPDGQPFPFTSGQRDSTPRFSPNGKQLAFVRPDSKGKRQLWAMHTSGGEARQLTSIPGGISEPAWSPDSRALAFVSTVDTDQLPEDHDPKKDPRVKVVRRVRYRADTIGWLGDAFRHLFVVDVDTGSTRQLTDGEGDDGSPAWSPDGTKIAYTSDNRHDRDFANNDAAYVVPATGGEPVEWSQGLSTVSAPVWSPDGTRLAVIGSDDDDVAARWHGRFFVLEQGQPPRQLTGDSVRPAAGYAQIVPPPEIRWTRDDRIVFIADAHGASYLCEVSAAGGEVRRIAGGGALLGSVSFDTEAHQAAVTIVPPSSSGDLHLIELSSGSTRQLTEVNKDYFSTHPAARIEKFTLLRKGMTIESRLFLPPDFDPSKKYPLILDIHGGPHGVFSDAFNAIQQVLATSGYIVLAVNPRGSSTYGVEFMKAVLHDWGGGDYLDIMAAVDEVCSRPYIDTSRLGITGYSYGGYMSSWIVGHDTRFKAAVVGAPVTNLASFYGTSDIGIRFGETQIGGSRMDNPDAYIMHSPLTYAPEVETPVLLMHGEADMRCPIEQSEQYFAALKRLSKEVEFVRFPDCAHSFLRGGHPRLREEYLSRTLMWFNKYIGASAITPVAHAQPVPADN